MALFLIAASVVGLAVTADRSHRTALSGGLWTSYAPGQPIVSGVDVIGHKAATVAVSGRALCVRRLGGQVFLSTGPCGP